MTIEGPPVGEEHPAVARFRTPTEEPEVSSRMAAMPNDTATQKVGYVDESDVDLILVLDAHRHGPLTKLLLHEAGLTPRR